MSNNISDLKDSIKTINLDYYNCGDFNLRLKRLEETIRKIKNIFVLEDLKIEDNPFFIPAENKPINVKSALDSIEKRIEDHIKKDAEILTALTEKLELRFKYIPASDRKVIFEDVKPGGKNGK
jgi:hypothetical protein